MLYYIHCIHNWDCLSYSILQLCGLPALGLRCQYRLSSQKAIISCASSFRACQCNQFKTSLRQRHRALGRRPPPPPHEGSGDLTHCPLESCCSVEGIHHAHVHSPHREDSTQEGQYICVLYVQARDRTDTGSQFTLGKYSKLDTDLT